MRALWSDRQDCSHNVSQKLNVSGAFLIHRAADDVPTFRASPVTSRLPEQFSPLVIHGFRILDTRLSELHMQNGCRFDVVPSHKYWPSHSAEVCRGFLLYKIWRILLFFFFSGGFFWPLFPTKLAIESGEKSEKIRRPKNKNPCKNPFCQKPTLTNTLPELRFSGSVSGKTWAPA